ncbi:MAG: FKBP-type peptidyl-prolyl cis-trans isomerase [Candidatus Undinarchaeales archaeon]|jgi:FKBP-type peptidyl-prolyl cis-trans isomerase 2|nr:FKBP-type peptidyl-prolyl cis-trans isomerase [Candidatus Undinarchaeales archaeon]
MAKKITAKKKKDLAAKIESDIGRAVEKIAGTKLKERFEKRSKMPYFYLSALVVIVVITILVVSFMYNPGVGLGDRIRVAYVGMHEDGTVFENDTTVFTVGEGTVIKGIEFNVQEMKEGEEKRVSVSPKYGYGETQMNLWEEMPATYKIMRYVDMIIEDAEAKIGDELVIGNIITMQNYPWSLKIVDIDETFGEVRFEQLLVEESAYYNPILMWWPIKCIEIGKAEITMRHIPKIGSTAINKQGQVGRVIKADEELVIVDYNHLLSGKTLIFDITVDKILSRAN